jgi:hypothetical protein
VPASKTSQELQSAIDSMFRIRAVESPPDALGARKVWHRGARAAELVSEIDGTGRVTRHEFSLFDEVLIWERGRGFVTGGTDAHGSTRGAAKVDFDLTVDGERLARMAGALRPYAGPDRIINHLRELVVATQEGQSLVEDLGAVTGSSKIPDDLQLPPRPAPPDRFRQSLNWLALGLLLIALGLALLALLRP